MSATTTPPSKTKHSAMRLLRASALIYLGVLLVLTLLENMIIYPAPRETGTAGEDGFEAVASFEEAHFQSADGTRLHGRLFHQASDRGCLLYCHGNGDMVRYLTPYADQLHRELALSVFIFDYRGYGHSAGSPNERGVIADSLAARQWFAERLKIEPEEMILMGRSLGGGVAVSLAAECPPRGLILQSTFTSMPDVAAAHYPWLPVRLVMKNKYDSLALIPQIRCPLLQSHGTIDSIIPFRLGERLYQAANDPKEFFVCDDRDHNDAEPRAYEEALQKFVDSALGEPAP